MVVVVAYNPVRLVRCAMLLGIEPRKLLRSNHLQSIVSASHKCVQTANLALHRELHDTYTLVTL
jgi:hypothetical protein